MAERTKNIDVALIYELWNEVAKAITDGDLEHWISLWINEGIQMAPDTPPRCGKEQIQDAMKQMFDLYSMRNMVVQTEEVHILGDRAYAHGTYKFEGAPMDDEEIKVCSGKFLDILAKQADGSWKIAIDCHNYNAPTDLGVSATD